MQIEGMPTVEELDEAGLIPSFSLRRRSNHPHYTEMPPVPPCTESSECRLHLGIDRRGQGSGPGEHYLTYGAGDQIAAERRETVSGRREKKKSPEQLQHQIAGIRARIDAVLRGEVSCVVLGRDTPWGANGRALRRFVEETEGIGRAYLVFRDKKAFIKARAGSRGRNKDIRELPDWQSLLKVISKYDPKKPLLAYIVHRTTPTVPPSAAESPAPQTPCPDRTSDDSAV